MLYDGALGTSGDDLRTLSKKTADFKRGFGHSNVALYAWLVGTCTPSESGGRITGRAWLGDACDTGTGGGSKTSVTCMTRGIIETAEVSCPPT